MGKDGFLQTEGIKEGCVLKIRLLGRTRDIKWYRKMIDRNKKLKAIRHSEILPVKGSERFFRAYSEVERAGEAY